MFFPAAIALAGVPKEGYGLRASIKWWAVGSPDWMQRKSVPQSTEIPEALHPVINFRRLPL